MKTAILLVLGFMTVNFAEACVGEAQIIAEVQSVQPLDSKTCLVSINPYSVRFFSANGTCPLDLNYVFNNSIRISTKSDGVCPIHPGAEISGVLVVNEEGNIFLE